MRKPLQDLKLTLEAIQAVRTEWLAVVQARGSLTHPECQVVFERLLCLYGTLGESASTYSEALAFPQGQVDLKKVA